MWSPPDVNSSLSLLGLIMGPTGNPNRLPSMLRANQIKRMVVEKTDGLSGGSDDTSKDSSSGDDNYVNNEDGDEDGKGVNNGVNTARTMAAKARTCWPMEGVGRLGVI